MSLLSKNSTADVDRIPIIEKLSFGLRAFAQQLGNNGMNMFAFPAYGIILGLDPAVIGLVFALMRLYDGVTDPLVGWLSDNTRSRWGRRRPWIFVGAIMGGLMFMLLWQARPDWSETAKTIYFIGFSLLFYTGFTMVTVPTDALAWELTPDYAERTRLMTWFSVMIKVTLFVLPWMFSLTQMDIWENEAQGLRVVGIFFGFGFILCGIMPAIFCKERYQRIAKEEGRQTFIESLKLSFSNKTYLLVCSFTLSCVFAGTVYMLFGTHLGVYYLFGGDKLQGAAFFGWIGSLGSILGLITVLAISRFFVESDKKRVAIFGVGSALVGWLLAIFLISPAWPWLTLIPVALNAVGVGTFWLLLGSIMADVADADEHVNGFRREGSLAAVNAFLSKAAGTLGALLGGFALSASGFDADLLIQSPMTLITMKWIYVGFPIVGYGVAMLLLMQYPLTKERMLAIRADLEARRGAARDSAKNRD
ncbi:MFS transporter [Coraliomargarita sp. SDUM461004]|uniref:MFS transporter n=1 Tax=Thalassobacterium sedimentorum TaxID=3041258 RepID=A0ABU1AK99_9BACT|nr:MFS transporter [Coraliomargarita sp. SDUM461004]MDQ8194166.1 MFS transporter [Coraliomargarita sp. SDUM461004]